VGKVADIIGSWNSAVAQPLLVFPDIADPCTVSIIVCVKLMPLFDPCSYSTIVTKETTDDRSDDEDRQSDGEDDEKED
jgi:hypothetical protein